MVQLYPQRCSRPRCDKARCSTSCGRPMSSQMSWWQRYLRSPWVPRRLAPSSQPTCPVSAWSQRQPCMTMHAHENAVCIFISIGANRSSTWSAATTAYRWCWVGSSNDVVMNMNQHAADRRAVLRGVLFGANIILIGDVCGWRAIALSRFSRLAAPGLAGGWQRRRWRRRWCR